MAWPTSQDYNEAIQNPGTSFADPELKKGEVALNSIGLPVPRSGNFADVYEFKTTDGKKWALKLFTRKVAGLQERYAKIDEHLSKAKFPFTVGFKYMAEGIRIRGQWFPLLKMEWVEGFTLNEFVRDNAAKPQYLHALMQMWGKLTALLRDADFAHADLQHGNVLLVPATTGGKLGLRLIDYDGMWVPALADTHSGEVGHPNFQHPLRLKDRLYNADVDRFPHLVIAAALRATLIGGKPFWDKFDNGDNLLFKETDLRDPANSTVFKSLWNLNDSVLCTLVGKMALASKEPLRKTPWLDDLLLTDEGKRLHDDEEAKVMQMLGVGPHFTAAKTASAPAVQDEFNAFTFEDDEPQQPAKKDKSASHQVLPAKEEKKPKKAAAKEEKKSKMPLFIGGGVVAVLALVGIIIAASGGGGKKDTPVEKEVAKVEPKQETPKVVIPPKKDNTEVKVDNSKKKDETVEKKNPEVVVKKNPERAVLAEPKRVWKTADPVNFNGLVFSDDGSKLYRSLGKDPKTIHVHAAANPKPQIGNIPFPAGVFSMQMGPGGLLAITTTGNRLEMFDVNTSAVRFGADAADRFPGLCRFAAKMNAILVLEPSGKIAALSLMDGKKLETHDLPQGVEGRYIECTSDAKTIAVFGANNEIYTKTAGEPAFKSIFKVVGSAVRKITLSPDGAYLAKSANNKIHILETATGKEHRLLPGHGGEIRVILFSSDGRYLFSLSKDKTCRVWDIEAGKQLYSLDVEGEGKTMALSPDGQSLAIGVENEISMQLWQLTYEGATVIKKDPIVDSGNAPALLKAPFSKEQAEKARADWAKFLNISERKELDVGKGVKLELVLIPPGQFMMGVSKEEAEEIGKQKKKAASKITERRVVISTPFYLAATETTQEQYEAAMRNNPSATSATGKFKDKVVGIDTAQFPVDGVTWNNSTSFCRKIGGVLPTEAQWEYACRAGTSTAFSFGKALNGDEANCDGSVPFGTAVSGPNLGRSQLVKQYKPNPFGLYDMHGNVWEWCRDNYDATFQDLPEKDPERSIKLPQDDRTLRGGAWNQTAAGCRSPTRRGQAGNHPGADYGFRVSLPVEYTPPAIVKLPDPEPKDIGKKDPIGKEVSTPDRGIGELKRLWQDKRSVSNANGSPISFTDDGSGILVRLTKTQTLQRLRTINGVKESEIECGTVEDCKGCSNNVVLLHLTLDGKRVNCAYDLKTGVKLYDLPAVCSLRHGWPMEDSNLQTIRINDRTLAAINLKDGTTSGNLYSSDSLIVGCSQSFDKKTSAIFTAKGDIHIRRASNPDWQMVHVAELASVATSPECFSINERYGALAFKDNTIRIFDSATGKELKTLEGHTQPPQVVQFATNPRYLISASDDQSLRVWDVETGKLVQNHDLKGRCKGMVISPDGQYLFAPTNYPESLQVFRFDPVKEPEPKVAKKDPEPAPMPKSPDELSEAWKVSATSFLTSLSFSKDGSRLATASRAQEVNILDARNGSVVDRQKISETPIAALTFAANNRLFAVDNDRHLIAWDLSAKAKLSEFNATCDYMQFAMPADKDIIYLPKGKALESYSLKDNKKLGSIPLAAIGEIMWMSVTADGENIVLVTNGGEVFAKLKDATEFKLLATFGGGGHRRVAIAPDGKTLAFTMNKEPIRILDTADGKELKTLEGHTDELLAIEFLREGNRLVSLARDNTLRLWNVDEGKQLFEVKSSIAPLSMAVSPDGKSVAVSGSNGTQLFGVGAVVVAKKDPPLSPKITPPEEKKDPAIAKAPKEVQPMLLRVKAVGLAELTIEDEKMHEVKTGVNGKKKIFADPAPAWLEERSFHFKHGYAGYSQFTVEKAGVVMMACSPRYKKSGNSSGNWEPELISPEQFAATGWKQAGTVMAHDLDCPVYWRECKKGETFKIRTDKYLAPLIIK